jgi:hypothetical protein
MRLVAFEVDRCPFEIGQVDGGDQPEGNQGTEAVE